MKWKLPGPDEKGYLKRKREISALLVLLPSPENIDKLAEYLVQFVEEPADPADALEAVLECPREEYQHAINHLLGYTGMKVSDPKEEKSGPS